MTDEWIVYVAFAVYSVTIVVIAVLFIREARVRHRRLVADDRVRQEHRRVFEEHRRYFKY